MKAKKEAELKDLLNKDKVIGLRQVIKNINKDTIECVVVSKDCSEHIKSLIAQKTKGKSIKCYNAFTSKELGEIAKIDVAASVIGILTTSE